MKLRKVFGRILVNALALCLAVTTTCVTAFAAEIPYDQVELRLSDGSGDTLALILSPAQQRKLIEACYPTDSTAKVTLTLSATVTEKLSAADGDLLASLVGMATPLLTVNLTLQRVVDGGSAELLEAVAGGVELTLRLPQQLQSGGPKVAVRTADGFVLGGDLDTVPNTLTCTVSHMGSLVLLPAATELAATLPTMPTAPPAAPSPTPTQSPKTGGPMEAYLPQLMQGSAVAVAGVTALPTGPASAIPSQLLASSLMMTTAMVSGEIDYENAQQREQEQQKADEVYAEMYDTASYEWMGLFEELAT